MSETTSTNTDGLSTQSDAPSSSAVETPSAPATSAPADSPPPAPSTGKDATPSPSSGDSRQSDREGLLAAVRSVVDKKPPTSEGDTPEADVASDQSTGDKDAAPGAPGTTERKDETSQGDLPDPTEGELRKLRPETRRRFEQLLRQRNEARQFVQSVTPELNQHRELAGRIQEAQLAPDDLNQLLFIGSSLRKQDYRAFLEGVTPYVMAAQEALGLRIAPDLQNQVNDGTLSEEAAREFTRTRHRAAQAEQRLKDQSVTHTTESQVRAVGDIRAAVTNWEAAIRTRDPDFAHKADTVRRFSQGLMQERGAPQTPEQAVAMVQAAYEEANRTLVSLRPRPQPTLRTPSSVHVATGGADAQPRTMLEAAQQALAKMRRAS
jgi:hypothetical protein